MVLSETDYIYYDTEVSNENFPIFNPLAESTSKWYEFYKRVNLFPWWIKYNLGFTSESILKNDIIRIGSKIGLKNYWMNRTIRHAVSEFSKKGLGFDYYGYHNIHHELEATYFTLLAALNQIKNNKFNLMDVKYLFTSALFHDYDPQKRFDKPNEDSVEVFIRNDKKIRNFLEEEKLNVDILAAIIHRTAYPFQGDIAEYANKRINELLTTAGISHTDTKTRLHYTNLGWFLSVSERIAGYALGDFEHAMNLARLNAHSLGWHPSVINEESVKFFSLLKEEKDMLTQVLDGMSGKYKQNLMQNITNFRDAWLNEVNIRNSIRKKETSMIPVVEDMNSKIDSEVLTSVFDIHREIGVPVKITNKQKFLKSILNTDSILVTLRTKGKNQIIGFAKGGPLESYHLRRGTKDKQVGKKNTIYMESTLIKSGYWGEKGGHILRFEFLRKAKRLGYKFVTGYVHRNVLVRRMNHGEPIQIIQKYDPDKLDYYRVYLNRFDSI